LPAPDVAPPPPVAELLRTGLEAHLGGDQATAEERYGRALELDPHCADALNLLGVIRRTQGRVAEAVALLRRAVSARPDRPVYWHNLGNAHGSAGDLDDAVAAYDRALALGGDAEVTKLLAEVLSVRAAAATDRAAARADLGRVVALAPDNLAAIDRLMALLDIDGVAGMTHRPWSIDAASPIYQAALTDLQTAAILAHRAWSLAPDAGRWRTAWQLANWVIGDDDFLAAAPADPMRWIGRGNLYRRQGRHGAAEHAYRRALELSPGHPLAGFRLALLLLVENRLAEADRLLRAVEGVQGGRHEVMRFDPAFFTALRNRAPPPPAAEMPILGKCDLVVFAACDGIYFERFADRLLHSIHANAGLDCRFHLHVINPPADLADTVAHYRRFLGGAAITFTTETVDAAALGDEARTYYAASRFLLLPHLLARVGAPVLALDVDTLVVGDLRGLLAASAEGDFALICGDPNYCDPWEWMYAGQILIRNGPAAEDYFGLVARYVAAHLGTGKTAWFLDQTALVATWHAGFDGRPRPRLIRLTNDVSHQGMFVKDGIEQPIPPEVLFWPCYASLGRADGLNVLSSFRRYAIPKEAGSHPRA